MKKSLLEYFKKHPNSMFEVNELVEAFKDVNYNTLYNTIQSLVKDKEIVKVWPGLNGGRKCSYTLK